MTACLHYLRSVRKPGVGTEKGEFSARSLESHPCKRRLPYYFKVHSSCIATTCTLKGSVRLFNWMKYDVEDIHVVRGDT